MNEQNQNEVQSKWPEIAYRKSGNGSTSDFPEPLKNGTGGRKVFVAVIIGVSILVITATIFIFQQFQSPNVSLTFSKPEQVMVGEQFIVNVSFANNSDKLLKDARLSLTLPQGISFSGQLADRRVLEQTIGDLGPGSINQQNFELIATDDPQTVKKVAAILKYTDTNGRGIQFERKSDFDVVIGQPAVSLNFTAPKDIISGTEFDVVVNYQNNTDKEFKNLRLQIDYQPMYQFKKASLDPTRGTNYWDLPPLPPGTNGTITLSGTANGPEKAFFGFNGVLSSDFRGQAYKISDQKASVSIATSPLSVFITANASSDYLAKLGDNVNYKITYKNNTNLILQNAKIRATLLGDLFDFTRASADVPFDSVSHTFTWIVANAPQLAAIPPGQEGSLNLSIPLKNAFPITRVSDKNYTLKIHVQIESPTVPPDTALEKTSAQNNLETKVAGKTEFDAQAFWRDAKAGILNGGPFPPRVNKPTQYSIHWVIKNYATDLKNVRVSGYLQSGARWTGVVKSNMPNAEPKYDQNTGLVTWNVGSIPATKGVLGAPAEAVFQMEVTPGSNLLGQTFPLLGESSLLGEDDFTGQEVQLEDRILTTTLTDDTSIQTGYGTQP